jgi:hypothetical protein
MVAKDRRGSAEAIVERSGKPRSDLVQARWPTTGENHVVRKQFNTLENLSAIDVLNFDRSVYHHSQCRH